VDRPENSSPAKRLYYAAVLKPACRGAAAVLTVSEFSRRRIIEWSGVDGAKVINVGNGVDAAYGPDGPRHEPGYRYLLMVSNRKGHKNEERAVQAFAGARLDAAVQLLVTGNCDDALMQILRRHGVEQRVRFTGLVAERDMPALYRGAQALVFPSLYEGFGLPLLEAMASGVPVIASRAAALPEVAGDAALLVDGLSVDELSRAIETLAADATLRQRLCAAGLQRARQFQWPEVAHRVQQVLKAVEGGQRAGQAGWPAAVPQPEPMQVPEHRH
jgi:glycosyltransferase involved in cell wall biosynthesis